MQKILLTVALLAVAIAAKSQTPGFTRSGSPLPFISTVNSNHTYMVDRGGGAAPANLTHGTAMQLTALENDKRVWNVQRYGASGGGSLDAWIGVEAATVGLRASGGTLLFPDGAYKLTNGIYITGRSVSGPLATLTGNIHIKGTRLARLDYSGATNAIEVVHGSRFVTISDIHILGTNSARLAYPTNDGILMHGPSGISQIEDCSFQNLRTGVYAHDMTGLYVRNIVCWSNFVGTATGYKPDNVEFQGRWDRNVYGVFMHMTNGNQHTFYANSFSTIQDFGCPKISGVFGYNDVGILLPRGIAHVEGAYFEGNGTSIQLGLNSGNSYENTYNTTAGTAPVLYLEFFDANAANHLRAYRASVIYAKGCRWLGSEIRLMNAAADGSTIDSDTDVVVRLSNNSTLTVTKDLRYVNGVLVPRSALPWASITGVPAGFADGVDDVGGGGGGYWETNDWDNGIRFTNDTHVRAFADIYWKMDETGTRRDTAGTNDLYEVGGSLSAIGGKVGNAVTNEHGAAKFLVAADSPELRYQGKPWHFAGWFNCIFNDGSQISLAHKTNEWRVYYTGVGANRVRVQFGDADLLIAVSPGIISGLVYVQAWWDGTSLNGSINNGTTYSTNLNTSSASITPPTPGTGGFSLMRKYTTSNAVGADEVFFMHRNLGSGERTAFYNSGNGATQNSPSTRTINLRARDLNAGRVASHRFHMPTNIAPTSVTVGTTTADRWIRVFDADGNEFYIPAWVNH